MPITIGNPVNLREQYYNEKGESATIEEKEGPDTKWRYSFKYTKWLENRLEITADLLMNREGRKKD